MKGILLSSGRHSGGNTCRAAAKGGERRVLAPTHPPARRQLRGRGVSPFLQHHLAGPPQAPGGARDLGGRSGGLTKKHGCVPPHRS